LISPFGKISKIHFVGIGGIGMSGIAEIMHNMGFIVSGSDISESTNTNYLKFKGIKVYIGHNKEYVKDVDVLVYSTAVKENNPEIIFARENYIPVIRRGEMLAELMRMKYSIAISGSHGKTTTSSMIAEVFNYAKCDPTVIIGGRLNRNKANASYGLSLFMISEADESDKSFLLLNPTITVVTNIDREHFETYKNIKEIKEAFIEFNNKVPFYGYNILCLDNGGVADIIPCLKRRFITYGINASADVRAFDIKLNNFGASFNVFYRGEIVGRISLKIPGIHNILNALAAITVSLENEIGFNDIQAALESFEGVQRRLTIRYKNEHLIIIDDYAHHPAEIQASIKALRESFKGYELVVVFQPHRYTRVKHLMDLFSKAFFDVDKLYVTDIYPASEEPIVGVHSIVLVDEIKKHGLKNAFYLKNMNDFLDIATCYFKNKTIIVTMGAGDITKFSHALANVVSERLEGINYERLN
jgi:UDP-N-acetylmuramate--alanine ligase